MRLHIFQYHRILNLFRIIPFFWSTKRVKFICINQNSLRSLMFFFSTRDLSSAEKHSMISSWRKEHETYLQTPASVEFQIKRVFKRLLFPAQSSNAFEKHEHFGESLFTTFAFSFFFNSKERWLDIFSKDYSSSA